MDLLHIGVKFLENFLYIMVAIMWVACMKQMWPSCLFVVLFVHFPFFHSSLGCFCPFFLMQYSKPCLQLSSGSNNGFPVVEAFGSFIMDIFTSKSDLDLSINYSREESIFPRDRMISVLRKFARRLYALQSKFQILNTFYYFISFLYLLDLLFLCCTI